jgi:hypothetical protein
MKTEKKRRLLMKEFRCFYFHEKNNDIEKDKEAEPKTMFNLSLKSINTKSENKKLRQVFSEKSDNESFIKSNHFLKRMNSYESNFSFMDDLYEDTSPDKSTKINNVNLVKLKKQPKKMNTEKEKLSRSSEPLFNSNIQNSFMVKITSEKKTLKETFHYNLKKLNLNKQSGSDLREGVNKIIHLKKFKKAITRKIRMKKQDKKYSAVKFTQENFRHLLHLQLR